MTFSELFEKEFGFPARAFPAGDPARIENIRRHNADVAQTEALKKRLEAAQPEERATLRYSGEYTDPRFGYASYKPGIDDDSLDSLLNAWDTISTPHAGEGYQVRRLVEKFSVIEIGGGPAYIAARGPRGGRFCVDIVEHPGLAEREVDFIQGDICTPETLERIQAALRVSKWWLRMLNPFNYTRLVALSYCLDRVSDQRVALRHFAELIRPHDVGLITVCLPATPTSPGLAGVEYNLGQEGNWVTRGKDAFEDYRLIVAYCQEIGLTFTDGGETRHYGISVLDGYEELPCYIMVFKKM